MKPSMLARSTHQEFVDYWCSVKPQLDEGCRQWIPELSHDLAAEQQEAIYRTLEAGKRLRGCLVCLMSEALGGTIAEAIPRAVAVECIQTASLIHDDFVDQDSIRRNGPAIWTLEGARRAVLLGDLMFATAIRELMELSREDGLTITQAIATMARGVYQEPLDPSTLIRAIVAGTYRPDIYNDIIRLKTGALFGTASKLGALAARASGSDLRRAFEFGARLGEAYQLADDLEEVLRLDDEADARPARIATLAPVLLYFYRDGVSQLAGRFADGGSSAREWMAGALPELQRRMREDIQSRIELALEEIKGFPDNQSGRLLRAAPFEVVRMHEQPRSWPLREQSRRPSDVPSGSP